MDGMRLMEHLESAEKTSIHLRGRKYKLGKRISKEARVGRGIIQKSQLEHRYERNGVLHC